MIINKDQIESYDQPYRRAFINSLAGFRQATLVGTCSAKGHTNLAIFNSLIHLGANPALFGLVSRPDVVPRDTLSNILATGVYTLNFVQTTYLEKAHQTSARYGTGDSEFEAVGFTKYYMKNFQPPFVSEAPVKIAMKLEEKIELKINGTVLIIGSIQAVELPDSSLSNDGFVDLSSMDVLVSCGLDAYYRATALGRLSYAKKDTWPVRVQ